MTTLSTPAELLEPYRGSTRVHYYDEFLRIMQLPDTEDNFVRWAQMCYTLTKPPAGHS